MMRRLLMFNTSLAHKLSGYFFYLFTSRLLFSLDTYVKTILYILYMQIRTLILFSSIWGVGPATAQRFYEKGHRNLNDLRDESLLTASQRVGLQFYDDLNVKIPRHEVASAVWFF